MLADSHERNLAIDPEQSFIVQAPAGSGKTELLTQRFLALLSRVQAPEQIIALTFTRKAANEMRERIIKALQAARDGDEVFSEHQKKTRALASHALARNQQFAWNILDQPNRLRIMTLDSLCQSLSQAIPLLEKQMAFGQIDDKVQPLYLEAARNCLNYALENLDYQSHITSLLLHLDNRQDKLIELLTNLLNNRDQWLSIVLSAKRIKKDQLERALVLIENHELDRFKQITPPFLAQALTDLTRKLANVSCREDLPRDQLQSWLHFKEATSSTIKALAQFLLTGKQELRQRFDHHLGLTSQSCDPETFEQLKKDSKKLLDELRTYPEFLSVLVKIKDLPTPHYSQDQWQILSSLFALLPLLVAHLNLLFQEKNKVDFTTVSQQALEALGAEDEPTDLALYLDNTISHLLIDEFQDTSISQYHLLLKLILGWLPDSGKTLFVVGDPMQSIYRFRQAEVGLFLKVQQEGLGQLKLNCLQLRCNFRSLNNLVTWVNQQFSYIFPPKPDMESGAVDFHSAEPVLPQVEEPCVFAHHYPGKIEEAKALIEIIHTEQKKDPSQTIAILVRSRSQLKTIIRHLRQEAILYQGVDITLLANLPHIQDLWTLTKALLLPANRLAWFALLRSPYVGLPLKDCLYLAKKNRKKGLYPTIMAVKEDSELPKDSQLRLARAATALHHALSIRYSQRLSQWIRTVHELFDIEQLFNAQQKHDIEQYWQLLQAHEHREETLDIRAFETDLNQLYSQKVTPSSLQVMTIHKSKGLEFDCVILPGLSSASHNRDKPLLRWMKLPAQAQEEIFLISPIKAASEESSPLYDYLSKLDAEKEGYELQRLLYVAVTRAKKKLYLLDNKSTCNANSFKGLLSQQPFHSHEDPEFQDENTPNFPEINALSHHASLILPNRVQNPPMLWEKVNAQLRLAGVITHRVLQWLCDNHPENAIDNLPLDLIHHELATTGFSAEVQAQIQLQIISQVQNLILCPTGSWIIARHQDEYNELEILVPHQQTLGTRIVDRTFVENGVRWVIDFKTGQFNQKTFASYKEQVNQYAHYLKTIFSQPVQCGLYFLESNHWEPWTFT